MSDVKICPKCAEEHKAGIMEASPVPVATPGGTETVTVYTCERCGHSEEA